ASAGRPTRSSVTPSRYQPSTTCGAMRTACSKSASAAARSPALARSRPRRVSCSALAVFMAAECTAAGGSDADEQVLREAAVQATDRAAHMERDQQTREAGDAHQAEREQSRRHAVPPEHAGAEQLRD